MLVRLSHNKPHFTYVDVKCNKHKEHILIFDIMWFNDDKLIIYNYISCF